MSLISYPSKVLLFGEYTILNGSGALAIPYHRYQGHWSFENDSSGRREESSANLKKFAQHKCHARFDYNALESDLSSGLWFDSNIPSGHGLGSSGALIAALYKSYGTPSDDIQVVREDLARLEDFFHGASSGIDPLVSLIDKPLLIEQLNQVRPLEENLNLSNLFLLNTQRPRQTGPLVQIYREKLKDPEFKKGCSEVLVKEVNLAIENLIKNYQDDLFHHLWHISKFQWEYFPEMIPTQVRSIWLQGIESGDFILKLCGAGGGGYILGYNHRLNEDQMLSNFNVQQLGLLHF